MLKSLIMSDLAKCKAAHDMSQKTVEIHINNIVGKMAVKIMVVLSQRRRRNTAAEIIAR